MTQKTKKRFRQDRRAFLAGKLDKLGFVGAVAYIVGPVEDRVCHERDDLVDMLVAIAEAVNESRFDGHDFVSASRKLIEHKAYGR
jgi:hypothetical protein